MTKIIPSGKISKVWHYKFVEKRYSTLALSILSFAPAFLLSSLLNFEMQSQNTNQIINVGISVIICTFLCIFVFVHSLYVYSTQMEDDYKN